VPSHVFDDYRVCLLSSLCSSLIDRLGPRSGTIVEKGNDWIVTKFSMRKSN
jgi:hypothetical protein